MSLLEYPQVIPYTKFEHFGTILFWVMLRTNRDGVENPARTDRQSAWVIKQNL